jgi:enoyl-CoA hydratase
MAEVFTPENALETGFLDLVVEESELMDTAMNLAKSYLTLNMDAHAHSKKRLRAELITAMRDGLAKDHAGWSKQFLA